MDFHVERDGDHRFRLFGELDLANADDLYRQLEPTVREDGGLRLDLSQLTFMDSQGIHVLLKLAKRCAMETGSSSRDPLPTLRGCSSSSARNGSRTS